MKISGEYDVLVIGAGILGTASAFYLKKNNPSKEILLADHYAGAAQGNTSRSNAMFRNTFSSMDNQILSDTSIDYYLSIEEDVGLRKTGYLWLMSRDQLKRDEPYLRKMSSNGISVSRYSQAELKERIRGLNVSPSGEESRLVGAVEIKEGIFGEKCGRIDPDKLTNHYLQEYMRLGGKVAFNVEVASLELGALEDLGIEGEPFVWQEPTIKSVRVEGGRDNLRAKSFVVACGAWTNLLLEPLGIDGHVKAKKRQLFKVRAPESGSLAELLRCGEFNQLGALPFLILPKSGCFVKAIPENNEFWIGCDDDIGRPYINSPSRDLDDYKAEATYYEKNIHPILSQYLPEFQDARPAQMWAGLYSYNTLDYIPFVFEERNVIVVGGDSGSGIMKGDSLGRIVASLYSKGEDSEAELYGGRYYSVKKLGFKHRDVEREEWVL